MGWPAVRGASRAKIRSVVGLMGRWEVEGLGPLGLALNTYAPLLKSTVIIGGRRGRGGGGVRVVKSGGGLGRSWDHSKYICILASTYSRCLRMGSGEW